MTVTDPVSHPTCTALITLHHTVQPTVTVGGETDRTATTRQPKEEFESQPYGGGFGAGGGLFPALFRTAEPVSRGGGEADPTTEHPFAGGKWERGPGRPKVSC